MSESTAVLLSAGLDSAVLAAAEARTSIVHPIYVSTGLAWEADELRALTVLLENSVYAGTRPLARLSFPVADLYPPPTGRFAERRQASIPPMRTRRFPA